MKPCLSLLLSLFSLSTASLLPSLLCKTSSQPNPISSLFPTEITGTINGTTALIPIPYTTARKIIPAEYEILRDAYEELIPGWERGMYPMIFEGVWVYDAKMLGLGIGGFHRMGLRFPFVDRLKDGYSAFRYTAPLLVTGLNPVALAGASLYGETVAGNFKPACDGYAGNGKGETVLTGNEGIGSKMVIEAKFRTVERIEYGREMFVNITNQPFFGSALPACDNYITLYNTSITQGMFAPVPVEGTVTIKEPFYPEATTLKAYGFRMDNAFIERGPVSCESLKGYSGTGPGDTA